MRLGRKPKQPAERGRRQVLSGGGRPQAFSYYAKRTDQDAAFGRQQPREHEARTQARLLRQLTQRFGLVLAALVLVICLIDVLHLSSTPKVISLTPSSSDDFLQPTAVYEQAAAKLFSQSVLNANKVTVQTDSIQTALKQQFPELADVSITLPLVSHRPVVYIAPTNPGIILNTSGGSYVVDDAGKALLPSDKIADLAKLQLPVVQDQSGLKIKTGSAALPSSSVNFITTIGRELQAKGVAVESITLPPSAYELDVKPAGVPYFVKFNLHATGEAMQQVGTYLAVKQRLQQQSIVPAHYIDVRVTGRAYYL